MAAVIINFIVIMVKPILFSANLYMVENFVEDMGDLLHFVEAGVLLDVMNDRSDFSKTYPPDLVLSLRHVYETLSHGIEEYDNALKTFGIRDK